LNQPRYKWLAAIEPQSAEVGPNISAAALRLLKAAEKETDGMFILQEDLSGYGLHVNDENLSTEHLARLPNGVQHFWSCRTAGCSNSSARIPAESRMLDTATPMTVAPGRNPYPEPSPFELMQTKHIREDLQPLTFVQRDFLRLLLVKGGEISNQVCSYALKPGQILD
jgi:hypothetical protein